jgi:hypothetical protein
VHKHMDSEAGQICQAQMGLIDPTMFIRSFGDGCVSPEDCAELCLRFGNEGDAWAISKFMLKLCLSFFLLFLLSTLRAVEDNGVSFLDGPAPCYLTVLFLLLRSNLPASLVVILIRTASILELAAKSYQHPIARPTPNVIHSSCKSYSAQWSWSFACY